MVNRKFGIIGNHKITIKCLDHLKKHEGVLIDFLIFDPDRQNPGNDVGEYCDKHGIDSYGMKKINTSDCLDIIRGKNPDLILSISNYWIMKKELLSIPKNGVLNFHNGPPSNYRGVYVPSWVIMNGEKEHGVMWHFAEESIDSGEVVGFEMFNIDKDETAGTLMVNCINKGISLFAKLLPDILSNKFNRFPQNSNVPYYSLNDSPENGGVIDFNWSFDKIDRLVRGLNYIPFSNPFCYAKLKNRHSEAVVNEISWVSHLPKGIKSGQITNINSNNFHLTCSNAVLNIESCMDENFTEIPPEQLAIKLKVGVGSLLV